MRQTKNLNDGSLSIGDLFIQKCSPSTETFTITVNGIALKCRVVTDYSEIRQLRQASADFAETCSLGKLIGDLKKWAPSDPEVAARAYMLSEISLEPKVSQLDAFKIAKKCGVAFELMMQAIDQVCLINGSLSLDQEIEEQKKG